MVLGPGAELGSRYELIRRIGRGSSATVFEAEDTSLKRRVAVKVLRPELASDPKFFDAFVKEARAAASLSHANIMAVHDWGEDEVAGESIPFLVCGLLEGGSLRDMRNEGTICSPSQVIAFGIDACRALHYAHGQDLVHRDITPANLMFTADGTLKIADFGLARALAESGWTEPGKSFVGTARYASPEQAEGLSLTEASDVYSLGLILIEALSGATPFASDTVVGTLVARIDSDVAIPGDIPETLANALREMTKRDPVDRPTAYGAGVGLLGAAKGLRRPEPLPLVGLPEAKPVEQDSLNSDNLDQDGVDQDKAGQGKGDRRKEVFEPKASAFENPGAIAGSRKAAGDTEVIDLRDVDIDPDETVVDLADQTTVAEVPVANAGDEPDSRWPVLLLSLVVLAAVGWFGWAQATGANIAIETVPDVTGLTIEAALTEFGSTWELDEKLERDPETPQGSVIRTIPAAGTELEAGAEVSYWVSLGLPLVRVPEDDLLGRSEEQAVATLMAIDLEVGEVERVNSEEIGEGNVISIVSSALELPLGGTVDLVVSLGPQRRVIPQVDETTDPEQLILDLEAAGLGVELIEEFDDEISEGSLVSITPRPGRSIQRGAQVQVVTSLGPTPVVIPNTSGESLTNALGLLESAGFLAELIGPDGQDGGQFASCAVVGTDPPSPRELQPGNVVRILMSDCT